MGYCYMEQHQYEEIVEHLNNLLDAMNEHENELYIAIEIAHQLRDVIAQADPTSTDENE